MKIDEKNTEFVIDALITKIKSLELEVWYRDEKIKELKAELEKEKGGELVGKA